MAEIGDTFKRCEKVPEPGVYEHPCGQQATFSDVGDHIPNCQNPRCKDKGAPWELVKKTGTG